MRHIRGGAALMVAIAALTTHLLAMQQPPHMKPTVPGSVSDRIWQGQVRMGAGRTFVTDGGFAIDAAMTGVSTLPERVLAGKVLEDYMKAPYTDECALNDLKSTPGGRTYLTPSGVAVSATYVNYLRRVVPGQRARLRTSGAERPVVVVSDDKAVGVLMPVKQ